MINDHLHFGGGGDAVFRLERAAYEKAGFDVFTFSLSSGVVTEPTPNDYVCQTRSSRIVNKFGKFIGAPHVRSELLKLLNKINPDFVRAHLVSRMPLSIYSALSGWRTVQTLHGPNLFCATSWGVVKANGAECPLGIGGKCWRKGCISLPNMLLYSQMDKRLQPLLRSSIENYHCPSRFIQKKLTGWVYKIHSTCHWALMIRSFSRNLQPIAGQID